MFYNISATCSSAVKLGGKISINLILLNPCFILVPTAYKNGNQTTVDVSDTGKSFSGPAGYMHHHSDQELHRAA